MTALERRFVMACACEDARELPFLFDRLELQLAMMKSFGARMEMIDRHRRLSSGRFPRRKRRRIR